MFISNPYMNVYATGLRNSPFHPIEDIKKETKISNKKKRPPLSESTQKE